jgi:hypothetical protein
MSLFSRRLIGSSPASSPALKPSARAGGKGSVLRRAAVGAAALTALVVTHAASAQFLKPLGQADQPFPPYNPYPPGILPADLDTEIARVRQEVETIFGRYFAQWQALTPPTLTGNPPTLERGYQALRILGGLLNYDETMSPFQNEACAFCHMPYAGFSGPIPSVNLTMIAYPGTLAFRAGKRVAQRYTYSPRFPVLSGRVAEVVGI